MTQKVNFVLTFIWAIPLTLHSGKGLPESDADTHRTYPQPHDAPRSSEMARDVWEIKWRDREDSVAALLVGSGILIYDTVVKN